MDGGPPPAMTVGAAGATHSRVTVYGAWYKRTDLDFSITGANWVVGLVFPHREAPTRLLGSPSEVQHRAEHKFHVV